MLDITDSNGDNLSMAKKQSKKLTDQLRQTIDNCGVTRYRIAKETGISESTLSKFCLGQRGISMDALDRLGEYLGLEIINRTDLKKRDRKKHG